MSWNKIVLVCGISIVTIGALAWLVIDQLPFVVYGLDGYFQEHRDFQREFLSRVDSPKKEFSAVSYKATHRGADGPRQITCYVVGLFDGTVTLNKQLQMPEVVVCHSFGGPISTAWDETNRLLIKGPYLWNHTPVAIKGKPIIVEFTDTEGDWRNPKPIPQTEPTQASANKPNEKSDKKEE